MERWVAPRRPETALAPILKQGTPCGYQLSAILDRFKQAYRNLGHELACYMDPEEWSIGGCVWRDEDGIEYSFNFLLEQSAVDGVCVSELMSTNGIFWRAH